MRADRLLKIIDATAGRLMCGLLGGWDYWRSGGRSPGRPPTLMDANGQRLLIIRPGGMGDMILLLPALQALQTSFPNAIIDVVCETRNAGILDLAGFRGLQHRYDRHPWRLWSRLRKARYDVVIDTEQFHNLSAVVARMTGARQRIGFKINPARNLLYTHLVNYALDASESEQFMRLLTVFGLADSPTSVDGILADFIRKHSETRKPNEQALEHDAAPSHAGKVAVYVGAVSPYKRWPPERFKELIDRLVTELNLTVILVGGRDAQAASLSLTQPYTQAAARRQAPVVSRAGATTLEETAGILATVKAFIGIDCGLTHLAAALGIPTITLFGPSDPLKWGHDGSGHVIIQKPLTCSPCFIFGYHRFCRSRDCMTTISVNEVMAACRKLLA